jgi:hypothetical protein
VARRSGNPEFRWPCSSTSRIPNRCATPRARIDFPGHARALLALPTAAAQISACRTVVRRAIGSRNGGDGQG